MTNNRISLLDCTLRDGGFALEDETFYSDNVPRFSLAERTTVSSFLAASKVEYVEIGAVEISDDDKTGFAIYKSVEDLSKAIPKTDSISKFAGLFRGPDTPVEQIPDHSDDLIECLRVIVRYSELKKSTEFCAALSAKGYKTFVQPMVTLRYTDQELDYMLDAASDMGAHAVYFVDSYGYMTGDDISRLFEKFDRKLKPDIQIGFHAHNNINLAFENAKEFLAIQTDRKIVADCTCLGMGQGAGNCQTELLSDFMIRNYGKDYDYNSVLDACEIIERYSSHSLWGYSVPRMLAALNKTAYKFALALRRTYKLSYRDIHHILSNIPENLCHQYTPANTRELLKIFGFKEKLI